MTPNHLQALVLQEQLLEILSGVKEVKMQQQQGNRTICSCIWLCQQAMLVSNFPSCEYLLKYGK